MEQAPYKEHIATLAIEKGVDRLKDSQTAFEKLFAKRTDDTRHQETSNNKALRQELEAPYQKLCDYVTFMAEHDEDEGYKALLNTLNNSRSYYANILAKRNGKAKAKDED